MGKVVGVYMNKRELQGLQELGKELGLKGETAIIKTALKELENSKNGHNNSEPTVEIPSKLRVKAEIKQGFKEFSEETKREAEANARAKKQKEADDRFVNAYMKALGYEN